MHRRPELRRFNDGFERFAQRSGAQRACDMNLDASLLRTPLTSDASHLRTPLDSNASHVRTFSFGTPRALATAAGLPTPAAAGAERLHSVRGRRLDHHQGPAAAPANRHRSAAPARRGPAQRGAPAPDGPGAATSQPRPRADVQPQAQSRAPAVRAPLHTRGERAAPPHREVHGHGADDRAGDGTPPHLLTRSRGPMAPLARTPT